MINFMSINAANEFDIALMSGEHIGSNVDVADHDEAHVVGFETFGDLHEIGRTFAQADSSEITDHYGAVVSTSIRRCDGLCINGIGNNADVIFANALGDQTLAHVV